MSSVSTYKLSEELCTEEFVLVALHTSLEDHALAYALNRILKIKLKRTKEDLELTGQSAFPVFEWKDRINDRYWMLMTNNISQEEESHQADLFQNLKSLTVRHLIPEYKEVDYFLKIELGDECLEKDTVKSVLRIPNIVTAYLVDTEQLKSKHNLIF